MQHDMTFYITNALAPLECFMDLSGALWVICIVVHVLCGSLIRHDVSWGVFSTVTKCNGRLMFRR